MRRILLVLAAAALMAMMMAAMAAPAFARPPKATVCHAVPPFTAPELPDKFVKISVSPNAVIPRTAGPNVFSPHLQHGDFIGDQSQDCPTIDG